KEAPGETNPFVNSTHSQTLFVSSTADRECARDLKEKNCFVALDFEKEKAEASSPSYPQKCQLPDGQEIDLGRERFFCPEALFQPDLIERNNLGIHIKAFECISSCNPALWKILFGHIILSGGTGTCSGLRSRLQKEASALVSPKINVKVGPLHPPSGAQRFIPQVFLECL
uniref:Uncharacterized protein n=1 Tax=Capra hircus TaxID=9925 RepID=A0A452FEK9_CAPHI